MFERTVERITDYRPLALLFAIKYSGSRLATWRLKLKKYDFDIINIPSKINKNADGLS